MDLCSPRLSKGFNLYNIWIVGTIESLIYQSEMLELRKFRDIPTDSETIKWIYQSEMVKWIPGGGVLVHTCDKWWLVVHLTAPPPRPPLCTQCTGVQLITNQEEIYGSEQISLRWAGFSTSYTGAPPPLQTSTV